MNGSQRLKHESQITNMVATNTTLRQQVGGLWFFTGNPPLRQLLKLMLTSLPMCLTHEVKTEHPRQGNTCRPAELNDFGVRPSPALLNHLSKRSGMRARFCIFVFRHYFIHKASLLTCVSTSSSLHMGCPPRSSRSILGSETLEVESCRTRLVGGSSPSKCEASLAPI